MSPKLTVTLAALLALVATSAFGQTIGVVKRSTGQVTIERGAEQVIPAAGTEVQRGDRLTTGPDGHVTISMHTAGRLSVGPDMALPLDRYAGEYKPVAKKRMPAIIEGLASFLAVNRHR